MNNFWSVLITMAAGGGAALLSLLVELALGPQRNSTFNRVVLTKLESGFRRVGAASIADHVLHRRRLIDPFGEARESTEARVARLNTALMDALRLMSEVHEQVNKGQADAARLQKELATYQAVSQLSKEQAEGVSVILEGKLEEQGRKSFWQSVALNLVFFGLGVAVTLLLR